MTRRHGGHGTPGTHGAPVGGAERSQRQLRVGEAIRRALVEVLARGELRDPLLAATPLTVGEVRVGPDLRHATCFVSPLGGGDATPVLKALKQASPWLSGQVARRVNLKFATRLAFAQDPLFDRAERIEALLRRPEVAQDLGRHGGNEDGAGGSDKDA